MTKRLVRLFTYTLALMLLTSTAAAEILPDTGAAYTAATEGMTILQGEQRDAARIIKDDAVTLFTAPVPAGESPTTGQPIPADMTYQPMLVQISNAMDTAQNADNRSVNAAGLGKRAPWGGQYADIVYESVLYRGGQTRMTFLFYDSLAQGLPTSVGPVRSSRVGSFLLSQEWGGGFIYAGCSQMEREFLTANNGYGNSMHFNLHSDRYYDIKQRVPGVKAPDNYDVNVAGFYQELPRERKVASCHFLFTDDNPYQEGYDRAKQIVLDWGQAAYISTFVYDEATGLYSRFCGGKGGAPYRSYLSAEDRSEEGMAHLSFSNVIIQRVENTYPTGSDIFPVLEGVGEGSADIFIGGKYIAGYWIRRDASSPTLFFDDRGEPLKLSRGKSYIAHLSPMRLLAFAE